VYQQARRAPDSGRWFLKEFEKWVSSESKRLVCYGPRNPRLSSKLTICSRFGEVCFNVWTLLFWSDIRSLAIDWLCTSGNTPVYIYFQREFQSIQTPLYVRQSLAGQLLMADISNPPDKDLLEFYETIKRKARNTTPDFSNLFTDTCTKFPSLFGRVVVLFDAFDECDPSEQATISALIETFNTCGIRTYITTRHHKRSDLPENQTHYLEITAKDDDVRNYVQQEMQRRRIKLDSELEGSIVGRVSEGVGGM
jgi:hypothetical protein